MKTKLFSKRNLGVMIGLLLILLVVLSMLVSNGYSKYRTQMIVANEVEYSNQLAASFTMENAEPSEAVLIPGTTIQWNPKIHVEDKTELPAYLYVEVVGDLAVMPAEKWSLTDCVGYHGGKVYVYADALTGGEGEPDEFQFFQSNTIQLSNIPSSNPQTLSCYAYMIQITDQAESAAEIFSNAIPANP